MMSLRNALCCLFLCCVLVGQLQAASLHHSKLPDIDVPPGSRWHYVSESMTYNGLPMLIKMFEYPGEEADVEKFYSSLWYSMGYGTRQARNLGVQRIMGFDWRGFYITVQFNQEGSVVKGKVVVTDSPGKKRPSFRTSVPVPPGGVVASVVKTQDFDITNETVTIESKRNVEFLRDFYEDEMYSLGYQKVGGYAEPSGDTILYYQKGPEMLQITIKSLTAGDTSDSHILIHLTQ